MWRSQPYEQEEVKPKPPFGAVSEGRFWMFAVWEWIPGDDILIHFVQIQRMVISGGNFKPDTLKPKEVVSLLLDDEELEKKRTYSGS